MVTVSWAGVGLIFAAGMALEAVIVILAQAWENRDK